MAFTTTLFADPSTRTGTGPLARMATPLTKARCTEIGKAGYIKGSVFAIQDNKKIHFYDPLHENYAKLIYRMVQHTFGLHDTPQHPPCETLTRQNLLVNITWACKHHTISTTLVLDITMTPCTRPTCEKSGFPCQHAAAEIPL